MSDNFYQDKYFDALSKQISNLQADLGDLHKEISEIKNKVTYMYGFAAALGVAASLLINYLKYLFSR